MQNSTISKSDISDWCVDYISKIVNIPPSRIGVHTKFNRLGLDSAIAVTMMVALEEWLGIEVFPDLVFNCPTISALSEHVGGIYQQRHASGRK